MRALSRAKSMWLGEITVTVGITVVATLALAAGRHGTTSPEERSNDDRAAAMLAVWTASNLPAAADLYAGSALVGDRLRSAGLDGVRTGAPAAAGPDVFAVDSVVRPPTGGRIAVPVARFGSGSDQLVVSAVVTGSTKDIERQRASATRLRVRAGSDLLVNPRLVVDPDDRSRMRAGGVDLRILAFLAQAAESTRVDLIGVVADPSEAAEGLPARTIVLVRPVPAELATLVAATPAPFHPDVAGVVAVAGGTATTLTWPLVSTTGSLAEFPPD